jgi:septum formation topological specificity factor MinE
MAALQKDVAAVVQKYIKVANNKEASLALRQDGEFDFLEMHFPLDTVVAGPNRRI